MSYRVRESRALHVAPLLRAWLADGQHCLPCVRFTSDLAKNDQAGTMVAAERLSWDADVLDRADYRQTIAARLRQLQPFSLRCGGSIHWPGVGYYTVERWVEQGRRMETRVALVTGAAQGFGLAIADELASHGARVVLADLQAAAVHNAAARINRREGAGAARAVAVDVTVEESVQEMVDQAIAYYGGLDLLVSNAGVLRAGGLCELGREDFQRVTAVNYTAFYLCVKYASQPMKAAAMTNPQYTSDVVQINSKSGLQGSNRNFAYAGSKFGGIGLVQSFALELAADRIKVNAVCPGNYLDGPLWSDPEQGLFVQYLRAGKVPGARTPQDVRAYYEQKVPLGRGCLPSDVVKGILYLVDQEYETGQALPITGGQVMLG